MSKITLDTLAKVMNKVSTSVERLEGTVEKLGTTVGRLEVSVDNLQKGQEEIKELISTEIHGLAFLVAKTEMKLIERIEGVEIGLADLRKDMNAGFDRLDKTKTSYDVPIKVKKSVKSV